MPLYMVKIKTKDGRTLGLARGRAVRLGNATAFDSPSAARRAAASYVATAPTAQVEVEALPKLGRAS